jgi:hypothetical protein
MGRSGPGGSPKQFVLSPPAGLDAPGFVPRLYFEARIDLSDVRSGLGGTSSIHQSLDIILPESADAIWTRDMARPVDPARVIPGAPEAPAVLAPIPPFVSADYLRSMEGLFAFFLTRHWAVPIYRNFYLKLYSEQGESREEFEARCLELANDPFRRELDALHEIFGRRLEQIREKYLPGRASPIPPGDFDGAKLDSMLHAMLHQRSERITGLFLTANLGLAGGLPPAPARPPGGNEIDQRLAALEDEARQEIGRLVARYQERVRTVDEYTVHPNFKGIHLVRSCVLWVDRREVAS